MPLLLGSLFAFAIAAVVGLGGTWLALSQGFAFGAVQIGAWTAWPRTGTSAIDPYARAGIARSGVLPLGLGDGIAFFAHADDQGRSLDGRCDVEMLGTTPAARYWTLTLYDPQGRLVANALGRHGFTSREVVRSQDGSVSIRIAPRARPGNWLPTGGIGPYVLVLRLYDTAVGTATRAGRDAPMPALLTRGCG